MAEISDFDVDEDYLKQVIAGEAPIESVKTFEKEKEIVEPVREETETEPVVKSTKKKNVRQIDFEETFLKEAKIKDRRQMYINGDYYDKMSAYLRIISDGKVSMVGYIHNVLAYHMIEFKAMINELYQDKINKSNPL